MKESKHLKAILLIVIATAQSALFAQVDKSLYLKSEELFSKSIDEFDPLNLEKFEKGILESLSIFHQSIPVNFEYTGDDEAQIEIERERLFNLSRSNFHDDEMDIYGILSSYYLIFAYNRYRQEEYEASLDYFLIAEFAANISVQHISDLQQRIIVQDKLKSIYSDFIEITYMLLPHLGEGGIKYLKASMAMAERSNQQILQEKIRQSYSVNMNSEFINQRFHLEASIDYLEFELDNSLKPIKRDSSGVIMYFLAEENLFFWAFSPEYGYDMGKVYVNRRTLGKLISSTGSAIYESLDSVEYLLSELTNYIAPPVLKRLNCSNLVIVPYGDLNMVPFDLVKIYDSEFTFQDYFTLRYAFSLSSLYLMEVNRTFSVMDRLSEYNKQHSEKQIEMNSKDFWHKTRTSKFILDSIVLVGNPQMPSIQEAGDDTPIKLSQLPASGEEVEKIDSILSNTLKINKNDTETEIKKVIPQATLIHFATHAAVYSSSDKMSKSWIALSPDQENDGLLTIEEILSDDMELLKAELVVLSACETGEGQRTSSEGTLGFQWAFLSKGAYRIIVSLWPVSDKVTSELMISFYEHWHTDTDNPNAAESLKRAKLDLKSNPDFSDPKFWAAFKLIGAN